MLNEKVAALLNDQINKELYSAYLYLDFSNYYDEQDLDGFKNWYYIQAQEERDHAMLMMQYMQQNGAKVTLEAIAKPDKEYVNLDDALKFGLEHEIYVTGLINNIYAAAFEAKDFRTMQFLDWFVKEQAEEEDNASSMVNKFKLFATDGKGLHALDQDLQARVYNAPSLVVG
ncbi:MAG: ferritin [Parasporobacterium sp.]|nr:ferritin [Parasporobacterium sp.]